MVESYLYGGFAAEGPGGYDDAYVLSLPSFKWINVFDTGNGTTPFPHGACSANVINQDQMLIVGGWFTNSSYTDCDAPGSQGQHNSKLGMLYAQGRTYLIVNHSEPRIQRRKECLMGQVGPLGDQILCAHACCFGHRWRVSALHFYHAKCESNVF